MKKKLFIILLFGYYCIISTIGLDSEGSDAVTSQTPTEKRNRR